MVGIVNSPEEVEEPTNTSVEQEEEATSSEVPVEGAKVENNAGQGDEVNATGENKSRCPWMKIGLLVCKESQRREEAENKRREEKEQEKKRREEQEEGNPRGVKRGRVASGSDLDADLMSSGEEQTTSSVEDKGGSGQASTAAKRHHTS